MNNLLPLTHVQKRISLTDKVFFNNSYNNLSITVKAHTKMDFDVLKKAIVSVVSAHDSFKLHILENEEDIFQYFKDINEVNIETIDFRNDLDAYVKWIREKTEEPFQLLNNKLFYFAILRISKDSGEEETWIYFKMHHIISDGTSMVLISNQIVESYFNILEKKDNIIDRAPSYYEYIENELRYLESKRFLKDEAYWNSEFPSIPPKILINKEKQTHKINRFGDLRAERHVIELSPQQKNEIYSVCSQYNMSVSSFLISVVYILLYKVTHEEDIVVSTFFANRVNRSEKQITGAFVSTCPIRMLVDSDQNFIDFFEAFKKKYSNTMKHQKYPFNIMLNKLQDKKTENLDAFNINVDYQYVTTQKYGHFVYEMDQNYHGNEIFDLSIHYKDFEVSENLKIYFDYKLGYLNHTDILDLSKHTVDLIFLLCKNPDRKLRELLYSSDNINMILTQFNNTQLKLTTEVSFKEIFEQMVCTVPESTALTFDHKHYTYKEINKLSNQLAFLLSEKGFQPGNLVGVFCNRSVELIIFVLAVIKAGGTLLPLDPDLPSERIKYMLHDSGASVLLTNRDFDDVSIYCEFVNEVVSIQNCASQLHKFPVDNITIDISPTDVVYTIYTSGSTGEPKGVMIQQRSLMNLLYGMKNEISFESISRILSVTTFSFDIFIIETLVPLALGLNVILARDDQQKDPEKLNSLIIEEDIEMIQMTPSRMLLLMSDSKVKSSLKSVKFILLGGELLTDKLLTDLKKITNSQIYNLYGPTEATVWATLDNVTSEEKISIGKPLANTRVYIMDENLRLLPHEVIGEIVIAGIGVAKGYVNKEELTKEKFVKDPYSESEYMYRTGDLGKWSSEGKLYISGRKDQQVKIRGYRIEIPEVESALLKVPGVTGAAVILNEFNGNNELIAYLVTDKYMIQHEIREELSKLLPRYMIPKYIQLIENIPLTPNGKIDRKALPVFNLATNVSTDFEQDYLIRKLIGIWEEVLSVGKIDKNDDFFELGGNSLDAIRLVSEINNYFKIDLPLSLVFSETTVLKLSASINKEYNNPMQVNKMKPMDIVPLSNSQIRFLILQAKNPVNGNRFNLTRLLKITGNIDEKRIYTTLGMLLDRHRNLRSSVNFMKGQFVQIINEDVGLAIETHYVPQGDFDLNKLLQILNTKIDMKEKSLMKVYLLKPMGEDLSFCYLFFVFNHIIVDGISLNLIIRDFLNIYAGKHLPEVKLEYSDYSIWQKHFLESKYNIDHKAYWKNKMLDFRYTELPKKEIINGPSYGSVSLKLDKYMYSEIKAFCQRKRVTLFVFLLAAFKLAIYDITKQNNLSIGVPVSGRVDSNLNDTVGCFVNVLLIQSKVEMQTSIENYLQEINSNVLSDLDHQMYPYDQLYIDNLGLSREFKGKSLYSILFNFLPYNFDNSFETDDTTFENCEFGITASKSDLELYVYLKADEVNILASYDGKMYEKKQISEFLKQYEGFIQGILDAKVTFINELVSLS